MSWNVIIFILKTFLAVSAGGIISTEVENKRDSSVARKISMGHFPAQKTIEAFNWTFPTEINEDLVRYLFTLNFIENKRNVVFGGRLA